jgi:hypothetical protein
MWTYARCLRHYCGLTVSNRSSGCSYGADALCDMFKVAIAVSRLHNISIVHRVSARSVMREELLPQSACSQTLYYYIIIIYQAAGVVECNNPQIGNAQRYLVNESDHLYQLVSSYTNSLCHTTLHALSCATITTTIPANYAGYASEEEAGW